MSELDEHDKPRTNRAYGEIRSVEEARAIRAGINHLITRRNDFITANLEIREGLMERQELLNAWLAANPGQLPPADDPIEGEQREELEL